MVSYFRYRSAIHIIERGVAMATQRGHNDDFAEFLSFYRSRIDSDPTSISEWYVDFSYWHF